MADFDDIIQEINTNIPDNNTQAITAKKLRDTLVDLTDAIETQQSEFEDGIQTQQSDFETNITNRQEAFENDVDEQLSSINTQFATGQNIGDVGIDNEPTAGSENLVKSGGVYTEISQLYQKIDDIGNNEDIDQNEDGKLQFADRMNGVNTTGMNYVILRRNKTFAEQVTAENTIYEIRDVFDIGGTQGNPIEVTLPPNCKLKFNGGALKNCTIICSNTNLDNPSFDNVVLSGSIKNDRINVTWWNIDNTDTQLQINDTNFGCLVSSAEAVSRPAIINKTVSISSQFTIGTNADLICEKTINYRGLQTIDGGVITLTGRRRNHRISINNATASGTYDERKDLTIAGVKISYLICSNVKIDLIQGFTSGLLVESLNQRDFTSYSDFYLGEFIDCYNFIKIHCETTNSSMGWFTETRFHGGRFLTSSSSVFKAYARSFAFITASTSNMPSVSNLVIENTCIESSAIGIYVDGLQFHDCKFINLRNEGVTTLISENNLSTIDASYNNYLSVYRWSYSLDNLSTKLFNVVTPNSKGTNTYIWKLNAAKVGTDNKFTFKNTISNYTSPSSVYYIQPIYEASTDISEVQGKNDRLLISGSYKGALLLFKHDGRFQAKIKTLYSTVASANFIIFIVQDTYNTQNSGYRVVDNTNVIILNSGLSKQTTPYRIFGNLNVTNNIGYGTVNLANIPANTYVAIVVNGEVGDIEFCTKKENILISSERDILINSLQPTKIYGVTNYGTLFSDTSTGKICKVSCDRDGVVTSIVDSNGFADAKAIGDTASRPDVAVKKLFNNGYPYYDKTLNKQLYFDSKVTTAISSTQLNSVANKAVDKYISNTLEEGKKYYFKIIQLHQNAVVSITLCKSSSSTVDGMPINIESVALASTGKYTLETVLFTAPDPTVYTHINITIDSGNNIKFLTGYLLNEFWLDGNGYTAAFNRGADTDRPTLLSNDVGFQYFDTTLGKYICWNGTSWINLDGTPLN